MSCETYTQTRPVPACAELLTVGTVPVFSTDVLVYITKQNGKRIVQEYTTSATGEVVIDLTDPSTSFFNEFDGIYTVQVGEDYENPLDITVSTQTSKTVGISFVNITGSTETNLTLVVI